MKKPVKQAQPGPVKTPSVTLEDLLKTGAHFGHRTSRRHPRMKDYVYTVRNDVHVIDLEITLKNLTQALEKIARTVQKNGTVLLVGTKKQAKQAVKEAAEKCNMPYVCNRWLGGTFTNFDSISKRLRHFCELTDKVKTTEFKKNYTKKEQSLFSKELDELEYKMGGIKDLKRLPEVVFIVDLKQDHLAVKEARGAKVFSIGLSDTNVNPDDVNLPIPCNDDAVQVIKYITNLVAETVLANQNKDNK